MKVALVSGFILLFCYHAFAQAPGYVGKKFSLYYNPAFFITVYNSGGDGPSINLRHDFSADYVVSKSIALGGSVKLISLKLNNDFYHTDYVEGHLSKAFEGVVKLSGPVFSVYVKKFSFRKRGYIAPVGVYNKIEFCVGSYSGKTDRVGTPYDPDSYDYVNRFEYLGFNNHLTTAGFIYSFGRQSLFFDRLFVTTGGSLGLMLPTGIERGAGIGTGGDGSELSYRGQASWRTFGYFMLNINLGIGFLAL
ncbi:MAG TPA: hypothetical protein VE978_22285 [Chitinophagales bacterium]|nr:hypothetical protein [Chitinophagales bacterium]